MGTIFLVYNYSVTKILRKIRAITLTEKLRKITREEDEGISVWEEQRRFQLVFVAQPFTRSLPTRIQ